MSIETVKEETVMDKAYRWSDPRVTVKVKNRYDQVVPPLSDAELAKKKKEKLKLKQKNRGAQSGFILIFDVTPSKITFLQNLLDK